MGRGDIEYQVVPLSTSGEVLSPVVDHLIRADRSDRVDVLRAAHPGHVRSECLGDLYGERADASRSAIDEDALPRSDLSFVAKSLEGGEPRHGYRRGLLERKVGRLRRELVLGSAHVLGEGAAALAEYFIASTKLRHVLADRLNVSCHVDAGDDPLRLAQP